MGDRERREFPRIAADIALRVELTDSAIEAEVVNLGEQGLRMLIDSQTPPSRGDEILVELGLPDHPEPVRVLGWVTDAARHGSLTAVSLTFFSLGETDARRIRTLVESTTES